MSDADEAVDKATKDGPRKDAAGKDKKPPPPERDVVISRLGWVVVIAGRGAGSGLDRREWERARSGGGGSPHFRW